jgi:hypothetical protein
MSMRLAFFVFLIVWLALVIIGLLRPRTYLPFAKWNMKLVGKLYGLKIEPVSDDIVCRRMRIWYSVFLVFGLVFLFTVLTARFG